MKRILLLLICILLTSCQSLPTSGETSESLYTQAETAYVQGDYARSGALADQAAQRAREQEGAASLKHAQAATLAGAAYLALARYEDATTAFEQALPIILSSPETSAEDKAAAYNNLAESHREQAQYELALPLYQEALRLVEKAYPADSREVADAAAALGLAYHSQGQLDLAEPLYQRALTALSPDAEDLHLARLLGNLADLMWRLDRLDEAETFATRALVIEMRELGPEHPSVAASLNTLGVIHDQAGRHEKALESYERALATRISSLGPGHPSVATTHSNIAVLYRALKDYGKAEAHFVEAIRIFELTASRRADVQANRRAFADMYRAAGWTEKAQVLERMLDVP